MVPLAWTLFMETLFFLPGSSLPSEGMFNIPNLDKIVHIFLFGAFVSLWCYYFYRKKKSPGALKSFFFWIYFVAIFNGILVEYIQFYYIPGRSFDKGDIIADMIGAGLAYGICNIKLLKTSI